MSEYIYIPPELIPNILARLPVEDVLRCTSVCKSWYELITSPSFVSSHFSLASPNQKPRVLVRSFIYKNGQYRGESSYYLYSDNQTFDLIAKLDCPLQNLVLIFSLDGLVCLRDDNRQIFVLWNPSLRKSLVLPRPRRLSSSTVGFGFVSKSNDFKIVILPYPLSSTKPQVEIYQLSFGSWCYLEIDDSMDAEVVHQPAHLNGILHWRAFNLRKVNPTFSNFICSFDMKNEKFGSLMVPSCLRDPDDVYFSPSTFRESLCLIEDGCYRHYYKIWVMGEYGVSDSWKELFNINTREDDLRYLLHLRDNGEIIFRKGIETGNGKLVSYDCKNNRVKNDELPTCPHYTSIHTYVENLILIKGPNQVKIDEESTNKS